MSAEGPATTGNPAQEIEPGATAAAGTTDVAKAADAAGGRPGLALDIVERFGLVFLLVAEIVFFSVWSKTGAAFRSADNLRIVVADQSVVAVAALASIMPLIGGSFDLSVGSVALLADIGCAAAMAHHGAPLGVAILVALAIAAAIGLANGVVIAKVGVNSLIVTLGTFYAIIGVMIWYTNGYSITTGISQNLTNLNSQRWLGVPKITIVMIIAAAVVWYLLAHTPWGRYLQSVGSNPVAARLVGINLDRVVIVSFVLSGLFAGIAGVLLLAQSANASPNVQSASGLLFPVLVGAFLGATTIRPGRFNVIGTIVALFFIAFAVNGLTLAGVANWIQYVVNGVGLVVAVALTAVIGRRRGRV
jgi:ribose transport system permease protein